MSPRGGSWAGTLFLLAALGSLLFFLPAAFVFLFPGAFLCFVPRIFSDDDPIEWTAWPLAASLAFWIFSYWISGLLSVRISRFFMGANVLMILAFALAARRRPFHFPNLSRSTAPLLILFAAVVALRFVPFFNRVAGSVGDMTQHNSMTRIILWNDGFSKTYEPVMPFGHFGEYPLGFHTLSALIARFSGMEFYRATLLVTVLAYLLLHCGFYLILKRAFPPLFSLALSSGVLLLAHYPQFLNQWGSSPTALSAAFLFFGYAVLDRILLVGSSGILERILGGAFLGAGVLCHLIPPLGFAAYFAAHAAVTIYRKKAPPGAFLRQIRIVVGTALLTILPFLINFNFAVFGQSRPGLARGHEDSVGRIFHLFQIHPAWVQKIVGSAAVFAFLWGPAFSAIAIIALGWGLLRLSRLEKEAQAAGWDAVAALGTFALLWFLFISAAVPAYHLLQTERIHYFFLIPTAFWIGSCLRSVPLLWGKILLAFWIGAGILHGLLLRGAEPVSHYTLYKDARDTGRFLLQDLAWGSYWTYALDRTNASVTPEDLRAFLWIRDHVPRDAIFLTNDADGGGLIPAIAERKIWNPHGMDIWHKEELEEWRRAHVPTHLYLGKTSSPRYALRFRKEELLARPEEFRPVYEEGGCAVFEVLRPGPQNS